MDLGEARASAFSDSTSVASAVDGDDGCHYYAARQETDGLLRKLKHVFRRYRSQPVDRVMELINPMLRGWVNYFAVGPLQSLLHVHQRLGGEEGPAPFAAGLETPRLRLDAVE